jgi:tetratricopeptide (TPR) repeat protein
MKRALYLGAVIAAAAGAFVGGFQIGKRSKPIAQSEASGLVLAEYRAATFLMEDRLTEAEAAYNELAQHDQHSAGPYAGLAVCRLRRGEFARARELYEKALVMDPTSVGALIGLGSAYAFQSDYTNAAAVFERALSVNEKAADAHWGLAKAEIYLGENERARAHLERFKQLDPKSPRAADLESMLGPSPQPDSPPNAALPHR